MQEQNKTKKRTLIKTGDKVKRDRIIRSLESKCAHSSASSASEHDEEDELNSEDARFIVGAVDSESDSEVTGHPQLRPRTLYSSDEGEKMDAAAASSSSAERAELVGSAGAAVPHRANASDKRVAKTIQRMTAARPVARKKNPVILPADRPEMQCQPGERACGSSSSCSWCTPCGMSTEKHYFVALTADWTTNSIRGVCQVCFESVLQ